MGKLRGKYEHYGGHERVLTLENVGYVKEINVNLLSITTLINNGNQLGNSGNVITMTDPKGNEFGFDKLMKGRRGM